MLRVFFFFCYFPGKSQDHPAFTLLLQTAEIKVFETEPFLQQRQEVPLHCPRSLQHPPSPVVFPAPCFFQEPLQALQRVFALSSLSLLQYKSIFYCHQCTDFREGKKNKLDLLGPAEFPSSGMGRASSHQGCFTTEESLAPYKFH